MKRIKQSAPKLSFTEEMFFNVLSSSYPEGVIKDQLDVITLRLSDFSLSRASIHRYMRRLYDLGYLKIIDKEGKTQSIPVYKICKKG